VTILLGNLEIQYRRGRYFTGQTSRLSCPTLRCMYANAAGEGRLRLAPWPTTEAELKPGVRRPNRAFCRSVAATVCSLVRLNIFHSEKVKLPTEVNAPNTA